MAKSLSAGRIKVILAFLLLFGPAFILIFLSTRGCQHKFKTLEDYGAAEEYSFMDAKGKKYTADFFKDKIVLITTIQQTCPDSCAVSFWHLDQLIYQKIRKNKNEANEVRIISFLTDGEGNPVEDLSPVQEMLQDRVEAYDPDIWMLASGSSRSIYDFKSNGESLLHEGDKYFGGQAFQEIMLLLDKKNHLRMALSGKTEGYIRRMYEHIALLLKEYDQAAARAEKQER